MLNIWGASGKTVIRSLVNGWPAILILPEDMATFIGELDFL
jgi:hypothetical protein